MPLVAVLRREVEPGSLEGLPGTVTGSGRTLGRETMTPALSNRCIPHLVPGLQSRLASDFSSWPVRMLRAEGHGSGTGETQAEFLAPGCYRAQF